MSQRFIMLDTETTGLSPNKGDRIVEIGAIVVQDRLVCNDKANIFHHYLNPERDIPEEVVRIHGIDNAKVKDAPVFADIAQSFWEFIKDSVLVIHNAPFDLRFLMNEAYKVGLPSLENIPVIDTLTEARHRFPQQRNNLNALCDRFEISRGHRELHGALLDSELLAEVYLAMTGGRQFSLMQEIHPKPASSYAKQAKRVGIRDEKKETAQLMKRQPVSIPETDLKAHQDLLNRVQQESGQAIWHLPPAEMVALT
ncbi:MAG: DNA polymerase III subunit epsilon [Mariprofundales bacterium]